MLGFLISLVLLGFVTAAFCLCFVLMFALVSVWI